MWCWIGSLPTCVFVCICGCPLAASNGVTVLPLSPGRAPPHDPQPQPLAGTASLGLNEHVGSPSAAAYTPPPAGLTITIPAAAAHVPRNERLSRLQASLGKASGGSHGPLLLGTGSTGGGYGGAKEGEESPLVSSAGAALVMLPDGVSETATVSGGVLPLSSADADALHHHGHYVAQPTAALVQEVCAWVNA